MGTQADDEAQVLRLDNEWNEAYRRRDRSPLAHILADDFTGLTALGEPITKAFLMINPSGEGVKSITFSEQFVRVFGDTGISRGRLQIGMEDGRVAIAALPAGLRQARWNLAGGLGRGHTHRGKLVVGCGGSDAGKVPINRRIQSRNLGSRAEERAE
jgi:ketosteroid isomerase-like protein